MSHLEDELHTQYRMAHLGSVKRQYRAIPGRRFAWDFAFPENRILIEVHGGTWVRSGHTTGTGIARDCEKHNLATINGWHTLAFTKEHIRDGRALRWTQEALTAHPPF